MKKVPFILILFLIFCMPSSKAQIINVSDFGVKPNTFTDATEGVKQAIAACKQQSAKILEFPKGRYDFWTENMEVREYFISNTSTEGECPSKIKKIGLLFEDVKNLTIEGNGSLFIFHGKAITWALDHCENIKIQNITMDFERPSMSEMKFTEVTPNYIIAEIHPDSKYTVIDGKLLWYGEGWGMKHYHVILKDTIAGTGIYNSWNPISEGKTTILEPFKIRVDGDFSKANYAAGQILTVRDPIRDHVGAFVNLSKNIELENVTMHYMHGLGIISQFSENLFYHHVRIIPSNGRAVASFADGMHFSGCKGFVRIENSHFKGLHDDPVNVHGTYLRITEIHSPTELSVRFSHGQTYGFPAFYANDTVGFIHAKSMQTKGLTTVKEAKLISERVMKVTLNNPLPKDLGIGDCLENITWTPSLEVRNNRFERTNTRGILITTPRKVVVENNVFYRTGMHGVLIAGDASSWFESGAVSDVLIRNNIFDGCAYNYYGNSYAISVEAENPEMPNDKWVHRNVRIEGNTFKLYDKQILKSKSTENISFTNNIIEDGSFISSFLKKDEQKKNLQFRFENCTKVLIQNNTFNFNGAKIETECKKMKKRDIKASKDIQLLFD